MVFGAFLLFKMHNILLVDYCTILIAFANYVPVCKYSILCLINYGGGDYDVSCARYCQRLY